jgi:hypothetical protein
MFASAEWSADLYHYLIDGFTRDLEGVRQDRVGSFISAAA